MATINWTFTIPDASLNDAVDAISYANGWREGNPLSKGNFIRAAYLTKLKSDLRMGKLQLAREAAEAAAAADADAISIT